MSSESIASNVVLQDGQLFTSVYGFEIFEQNKVKYTVNLYN